MVDQILGYWSVEVSSNDSGGGGGFRHFVIRHFGNRRRHTTPHFPPHDTNMVPREGNVCILPYLHKVSTCGQHINITMEFKNNE